MPSKHGQEDEKMSYKFEVWHFIVALAVIALLAKYIQPQAVWDYSDTLSECEEWRQIEKDDGADCVTECFKMTSSKAQCASSYGYDGWHDNVNEWVFLFDSDETCQDYVDMRFDVGYTKVVAAVECFPEIGKYYSGYVPPSCTDTDGGINYYVKGTLNDGHTDVCALNFLQEWYCIDSTHSASEGYNCGGEGKICQDGACVTGGGVCNTNADTNCDGVVTRGELGDHITKWISGQVTRLELGDVIQAWVGG